jgi:hypothetical protein
LLTNFIDLSHSVAAGRSDTLGLPSILWNPKFYCNIRKSPSVAPILSQKNPVHTTPDSLFLASILILSSNPRVGLHSGLFCSRFPIKIIYAFPLYPMLLHALHFSSFLTWYFYTCLHEALCKFPKQIYFYHEELLDLTWNTKAGGPPFISYWKLIFQYIRSSFLYLEVVSFIVNVSSRHAVVTRDPLNSVLCLHILCLRYSENCTKIVGQTNRYLDRGSNCFCYEYLLLFII